MTTHPDAFAAAVQHYQAGQLQDAEQICRHVLAADPGHADALHLLGMIASQCGQHDAAADLIRQAIARKDDEPTYHSNLGAVLKALGKLEEAAQSCRRALELNPNSAAAHYNLGSTLQDQMKLEDAIASFHSALALRPDYEAAHNNLGTIFLAQGKYDDAVNCFRRTLELQPEYAVAHYNLGTALQAQGKLDDAVACFQAALMRQSNLRDAYLHLAAIYHAQRELNKEVACYQAALILNPNDVATYNSLGNALLLLRKIDEASRSYRRAVEINPDDADAHSNLGNTLLHQGKPEEAAACCLRALELKADHAVAHNNLGNVMQALGKPDQAIHCYRMALKFSPHYPEPHYNQSLLMLQRGDFEQGVPEYEWRWQCQDYARAALKGTPWDGSTFGGRVLLHTDQGVGDALQFVRYAPLVKQRAGKVLLRCAEKLIPLFSRCRGIDAVISTKAVLPECEAELHLSSLPHAFQTTLETVPREVPYLFADSQLVEQWRARLPTDAFKVGIAWQGNPQFKLDSLRSIPLTEFRPLGEVGGVRLISLQKGFGVEQLASIKGDFDVLEHGDELDEAAGAFMDTAAIMMNLDLVVTSDTSIAHLAGGLGVPVWVALSSVPEWRWLLNRSDSPWYPTMRLFRQSVHGDWRSVFEQMQKELRDRMASGHQSAERRS